MGKEIYHRKLKQKLSEFPRHYMSNTKWCKLFKLLSDEKSEVKKVKIVSIWKDNDSTLDELDAQQLKNFEETFNNNGIKDVLIGGPINFNEIKKLIIQTNSIVNLCQSVNSLGLFEKEENENEIIIFGYK